MIFLILQLSIISGLIWLIISFVPSSYHSKRNLIVVGFIFCWVALINSLFSSHWINYTLENPLLIETSLDSKNTSTPKSNVPMDFDLKAQSSVVTFTQTDRQPSMMQDINWMMIFKVIWLIGFIIFTTKWIIQIKNIYQIRKTSKIIEGFNVKFNMYWSTICDVPFLFAGKTCFIIIPAHMKQWPRVNIEHIVEHEMCHYQRKIIGCYGYQS